MELEGKRDDAENWEGSESIEFGILFLTRGPHGVSAFSASKLSNIIELKYDGSITKICVRETEKIRKNIYMGCMQRNYQRFVVKLDDKK